jgi:hypothetical protein
MSRRYQLATYLTCPRIYQKKLRLGLGVRALGGGILRLLPGVPVLRDAVFLSLRAHSSLPNMVSGPSAGGTYLRPNGPERAGIKNLEILHSTSGLVDFGRYLRP